MICYATGPEFSILMQPEKFQDETLRVIFGTVSRSSFISVLLAFILMTMCLYITIYVGDYVCVYIATCFKRSMYSYMYIAITCIIIMYMTIYMH